MDLSIKRAPSSDDVIMIVDDSPDALNSMMMSIKQCGYKVVTATTGKECLEKFMNSEIQLVVLDYVLPDMTGIEILKKIREHRTPEEVPVIMVTAQQNKELVRDSVKKGVNDFVIKPVRGDDLVRRVERLLINISDEDVGKIIASLHVPDSSSLSPDIRNNLVEMNLSAYPFKVDGIDCCAICEKNKNPRILGKMETKQLQDSLVLVAKGGFLWSTIWPKRAKSKYLITKNNLAKNARS